MSNYFNHDYLSNSDLKNFRKKMGLAHEDPLNLQAIFDFGTLFHATILEPNTVTKTEDHFEHSTEDKYVFKTAPTQEEIELAQKMKDTFFKDEMCRSIIMRHDFEREREFYRTVEVGGLQYNARCKADGYSKGIKLFLELKGLSIDNEKAFKEAIEHFDYDQAAVHYMLTSDTKLAVIAGISKKKPERMFKKIIKQYDDVYAWGETKLVDTLNLLREVSPEDVTLL